MQKFIKSALIKLNSGNFWVSFSLNIICLECSFFTFSNGREVANHLKFHCRSPPIAVIPQISNCVFPCLACDKTLPLPGEHKLLTLQRSESTAYWALKKLGLFVAGPFSPFACFRSRAVFHSSPFIDFR